jgi:hypothetical protein
VPEDNIAAAGAVVDVLGLGDGCERSVAGVLIPDDAVRVASDGERLEEEVVVLVGCLLVRSWEYGDEGLTAP